MLLVSTIFSLAMTLYKLVKSTLEVVYI